MQDTIPRIHVKFPPFIQHLTTLQFICQLFLHNIRDGILRPSLVSARKPGVRVNVACRVGQLKGLQSFSRRLPYCTLADHERQD